MNGAAKALISALADGVDRAPGPQRLLTNEPTVLQARRLCQERERDKGRKTGPGLRGSVDLVDEPDWVVERAVRCEPVSANEFPDQPGKYREVGTWVVKRPAFGIY